MYPRSPHGTKGEPTAHTSFYLQLLLCHRHRHHHGQGLGPSRQPTPVPELKSVTSCLPRALHSLGQLGAPPRPNQGPSFRRYRRPCLLHLLGSYGGPPRSRLALRARCWGHKRQCKKLQERCSQARRPAQAGQHGVEGESDPTHAHAAPNAAVNVTTEEEHTNEPYDMIGNDNPRFAPNFDVFDDFFEDSSEDVAKFAAEAEDVPQTSPANPVLPVPEPTGEPPTLSMRQRERLLQLYQNGVVSRETPKETDASVWRRYREQCKKEYRDHRRDQRRLRDWQPDLKRRRKWEQ